MPYVNGKRKVTVLVRLKDVPPLSVNLITAFKIKAEAGKPRVPSATVKTYLNAAEVPEFENSHFKLKLNPDTGFPSEIFYKKFNKLIKFEMSFVYYKSYNGNTGAYLFQPYYDEQPLVTYVTSVTVRKLDSVQTEIMVTLGH